jgi:hypothetical protein
MAKANSSLEDVFKAERQNSLQNYLELEALLNEFFNKINFCQPNCISKSHSLYLNYSDLRGELGCCGDNFHSKQAEGATSYGKYLAGERIKKYGVPMNNEKPQANNMHIIHVQQADSSFISSI